jgi:hypothetical protein
MDQDLLGFVNGAFDGLQLLSQIKARRSFLDHADDLDEMTARPPESFDDFGMCLVCM